MPEPTIHLYSPMLFHDEQYIVGNNEGLLKLHTAIEQAIIDNNSTTQVFTADGYGCNLIVKMVEDMDLIALPYIEDYVMEHRGNAIYPWEIK